MKLRPGAQYTLKYTGEFCHAVGKNGYKDFSSGLNDEDTITAIFVGTVLTELGMRNIFYDEASEKRSYIMFACKDLSYVVI